jgi:hypothetical protein
MCLYPCKTLIKIYTIYWIVLQSTIFFLMARQPLGGLGRLIFRGFTIKLRHTTLRHTTLGRTPLNE